MKRQRYEARSLGWHVVRIEPDGTESTVEVWPEEKAKHRAEVLDQRAAESFEARSAHHNATSTRMQASIRPRAAPNDAVGNDDKHNHYRSE
jgi:hypothetical protein